MSEVNSSKNAEVAEMLRLRRYEVTSNGDVISYRKSLSGRLMTPVPVRSGYMRYQLVTDSGERITFYAHRIVAIALIPNPDNLEQVNHIDGCKTNNHPTNLEWVTHSENSVHAIKTGLKKITRGEALSELTDEDVSEIRKMYATGGITQREIGEIYGLKQNTISTIVNKVNWRHIE